jgi:hypothetical protein
MGLRGEFFGNHCSFGMSIPATGENMDLKRLSILLISSGILLMFAGVIDWSARIPDERWLKEGYYHCLWASSYRVTSDIKPDFLNPNWNPDNASCATAGADSLVNFEEDAKRKIARITGQNPGSIFHEQPPFFLMPPFLNITGLTAFMLGVLIAFTRSTPSLKSEDFAEEYAHSGANQTSYSTNYDQQKWRALLKYDADVKRIADALAPYGTKYGDLFAKEFMAVNDKKYLPEIVRSILEVSWSRLSEQNLRVDKWTLCRV